VILGALRDVDPPVLGEVLLGLSELHATLQKLRLLLPDCARKGAQLWVLMNAKLMAFELRLALGSVTATMDVLMPGDAVGRASADAREVARMASDHAWRATVRPDPENNRAARSV
jgi:hypothetical protein